MTPAPDRGLVTEQGSSLISARCTYCGRTVPVFNHPADGAVLEGHRLVAEHDLETPFCEGGGKRLAVLPLPTDGPDYHANLAFWKERATRD